MLVLSNESAKIKKETSEPPIDYLQLKSITHLKQHVYLEIHLLIGSLDPFLVMIMFILFSSELNILLNNDIYKQIHESLTERKFEELKNITGNYYLGKYYVGKGNSFHHSIW